MKNRIWGYVRYLLLGVITATALLWSLMAVPAAANAAPASGKGLVLSLPFSVDSHWTSVSDNTPGIVWQITPPTPPLTNGRIGEDEIKFGIQNGKFAPGNPEADTWFIYGWFGALEAIQQPYNVKYPEWSDRHNGIDFAGQGGIEVTSASNGTVIFAGKKIGNTVLVNAGNGYRITYGHLQDISVKRGDKIKAGDLIGHLGNTGTINPHLHFQVDLIKKGSRTAINPLNLIENTDWSRVVIPNADANLFTTENQNPLTQPDFNW